MAEMYLTAGGLPQPYDFTNNRSLTLPELVRLEDPCAIFEGTKVDSDGVMAYLYTVGGILDGQGLWPGCTVQGDVMIIHGKNRAEADDLASMGLDDTIHYLLESGVDQTTNAGILVSAGIRGRSH